MAGELSVTQSFFYQKGSVGPFQRSIVNLLVDVAGSNGVFDSVQLSTSPAALSLGALSGTLGWAYFHNTDLTNSINILTALSGTIFCSLKPGESAFLRLGSGITAPAAVAVASTPVLEYLILAP